MAKNKPSPPAPKKSVEKNDEAAKPAKNIGGLIPREPDPKRLSAKEEVQKILVEAGSAGLTAAGVKAALSPEAKAYVDRKPDKAMAAVRGLCRDVIDSNGWARVKREGQNVVYQAIPEAEAQAAVDSEKATEKAAKPKKGRKSKKAAEEEEEEAEEGDDDDLEEGDEEEDEDDEE